MTILGKESNIESKKTKSIAEQLQDLKQEIELKKQKVAGKRAAEKAETHEIWEKFLSTWDKLWSLEEQPAKIETKWKDGNSTIFLIAAELDGNKCINIGKSNYNSGGGEGLSSSYSTWLMYDENKWEFSISMKEKAYSLERWEWRHIEDEHADKYLKKVEWYIQEINEEKRKAWDKEVDKYASKDANLDKPEWRSLA